MVRGKFKVQSVTKFAWPDKEIKLTAVHSGTPEDNTFAKATPNGTITMLVSNPDAAEQLAIGKEFYVDFTPCIAE